MAQEPSARATRPRRRGLRVLWRSFQTLVLLGGWAAIIGSGVLIAFLVYQSRRLPELDRLEYGEISTWKQHTEIYADVVKVETGDSWDYIQRRLDKLGYDRAQDGTVIVGTYTGGVTSSGTSRISLFVRPFEHPRITQVSQPFNLRFENGALSSIETRDGSRIGYFYLEPQLIDDLYNLDEGLARQLIALEDVPKSMIDAVLAIEDNDFYKHPGIHFRRLAVVVVSNVTRGESAGASTITQQLARNIMLTRKKFLQRKIDEWILAVQIERRFSKDEILERYLNFIDLGRHSGRSLAGIKEAARYYFDKEPNELTVAECALLAAIPNNPTQYSPVVHPDRALSRRNLVLRQMLRRGKITRAAYQEAIASPLQIAKPKKNKKLKGIAPYFSSYIRTVLEAKYSRSELYERGMKVFTTLDTFMQEEAESSIREHLADLDKTLKYPPYEEALNALARGDHVKYEPREYLQAALVSIEPQTGFIRAMVGGRDFEMNQYNNAAQAQRQPGSAFKPFVYAAAMKAGYSPYSTVVDEPWSYRGWTPQNISGGHSGEVTFRSALERSLNVPAARVMNEFVGARPTVALAKAMGINSPLKPWPSLALGTYEVNVVEITSAYGVFANRGQRVEPTPIRYVVTSGGELRGEAKPIPKPVLDERVAATMVDMLQGVVNHGTAHVIRRSGYTRPAAGKTGTTQDYSDAWFIGFTPKLCTGIWVGFGEKRKNVRATGSAAAAPVWADYMKRVDMGPVEQFPRPKESASRRSYRVSRSDEEN